MYQEAQLILNGSGMIKAAITNRIKDQNRAMEYIKRIADFEFDLITELGEAVYFDLDTPETDKDIYIQKHLDTQKEFVGIESNN